MIQALCDTTHVATAEPWLTKRPDARRGLLGDWANAGRFATVPRPARGAFGGPAAGYGTTARPKRANSRSRRSTGSDSATTSSCSTGSAHHTGTDSPYRERTHRCLCRRLLRMFVRVTLVSR